jgi:antitoxin CptB
MVTANDSENKLSKVRWRCRRGMLELDVMLNNFCDNAYLSLSAEKQQLFELLLEAEDQDLQRWLVGSEPASNPKLQDMILVIRHMHAISVCPST